MGLLDFFSKNKTQSSASKNPKNQKQSNTKYFPNQDNASPQIDNSYLADIDNLPTQQFSNVTYPLPSLDNNNLSDTSSSNQQNNNQDYLNILPEQGIDIYGQPLNQIPVNEPPDITNYNYLNEPNNTNVTPSLLSQDSNELTNITDNGVKTTTFEPSNYPSLEESLETNNNQNDLNFSINALDNSNLTSNENSTLIPETNNINNSSFNKIENDIDPNKINLTNKEDLQFDVLDNTENDLINTNNNLSNNISERVLNDSSNPIISSELDQTTYLPSENNEISTNTQLDTNSASDLDSTFIDSKEEIEETLKNLDTDNNTSKADFKVLDENLLVDNNNQEKNYNSDDQTSIQDLNMNVNNDNVIQEPEESKSNNLIQNQFNNTLDNTNNITEESNITPDKLKQNSNLISTALEDMPEYKNLSKLKLFKKVGFIGLNSNNVNSKFTKKLKKLIELCNILFEELFVDSNKGYGKHIFETLSTLSIKIKGVYLKPNYSNYSDEADVNYLSQGYTSIVYSNFIERFNYLIKECSIFVIPEINGLNNFSETFLLLSLQYLYFGQNKPVILFGRSWENTIKDLQKTLGLAQDEVNSFYICSTIKEAIDLIIKLDNEYYSKPYYPSKKIIDMRKEDDESLYFVSNIK